MTTKTSKCQICHRPGVKILLDAGPQPLCNRFVRGPFEKEEYRHPLVLGQCPLCATLQLMDPAPAKELVPPFPWIINNEPEGHLDALTRILARLPEMGRGSFALGVTHKDDSTLRRLEAATGCRTWRIHPERDLNITLPGAGGETVQAVLTPGVSKALAEKHGPADLLMARHILEHASEPGLLMEALKALVKPGGYLVFEAPDCTELLEFRDYTMLWEEHTLYLTPRTFENAFRHFGLAPMRLLSFPYPVENALIAIVKNHPFKNATIPGPFADDHETTMANHYGETFDKTRKAIRVVFKHFPPENRGIAMFGAGHLAITYINLFGIGPHLTLAVDDDPNKQGLFMPGCRLSIQSSRALLSKDIRLCILSLRPELETKILDKHKEYLARGGKFVSIFPGSDLWLGKFYQERDEGQKV